MSKKKKYKEQTLIFETKYFRNKRKVKNWIKKNGFKILKYKKHPIQKYDKTYRVRQREPSRFKKETFRTIKLRKGVKMVVGLLK